MTRWLMVAGLAALNLVLAAGVYHRMMERGALAQQAIGGGRPVDVATVAGANNGLTVIYMLDVNSGFLRAYRLDVANKRVTFASQVNVASDLSRI